MEVYERGYCGNYGEKARVSPQRTPRPQSKRERDINHRFHRLTQIGRKEEEVSHPFDYAQGREYTAETGNGELLARTVAGVDEVDRRGRNGRTRTMWTNTSFALSLLR
jgi:hypothetical protein